VTGFRRARLAPKPDKALQWARASYRSAAGLYESSWKIGEVGELIFEFVIPFNAEAQVILPDAKKGEILINGQKPSGGIQQGSDVIFQLDSSHFQIEYQPTRPYLKTCSIDMPVVQILQNEQAKAIVQGFIPMVASLDDAMIAAPGGSSLREIAATPHLDLTDEQLDEIDRALSDIPLDRS
jgi:alpha-L-rhamnosidase